MKSILLILSILMLNLLIPSKVYSSELIQEPDTIVINKQQTLLILKDKARLRFLEKNSKQDSLLIQELEYKIKNYKESEKDYEFLLKIKEDRINKLKIQNKLILIGSGIILGGITYLVIK